MANTPVAPLKRDANSQISYFYDQNGNAVGIALNADGSLAVTLNVAVLPAAIGQQLAAGSLSVVLASNQPAIAISNDTAGIILNLILLELRQLNQALQDFTGLGPPRVDQATLPLIG